MDMQGKIITALGVKPQIDVEEEVQKRVAFLKQQVLDANMLGLLIAISGGLDSAVVAGLCKRATDELAKETGKPYETVGVFQPYGTQADIDDSYAVAKAFNLTSTVETNIEEAVDEIALEVEHAMKSLGVHRHVSIPGKGNIKARTRMVMQYAIAFERRLLVVGSDHATEILTGFFTKYGDGAVDLNPLATLSKRQVAQLAAYLGVPDTVIHKVPTAGLWEGQTDEQELGISYDDLNDYLEGKSVDPAVKNKIEKQYLRTEHKRAAIPGI